VAELAQYGRAGVLRHCGGSNGCAQERLSAGDKIGVTVGFLAVLLLELTPAAVGVAPVSFDLHQNGNLRLR
jgi:hypothetical protein